MPANLAKDNTNFGEIIYLWKVSEYKKYARDRRWYVFMGVVAFVLITYALFTSNYLFALLLVLFGLIIFLSDTHEPADVPFAITNTGIIIGDKYYHYSELENFWLIYNPPDVKNLYFSFNSLLRHRLQVPLMDYDPRPIREYLSQFLTEDLEQEEEPFSDRVARLFKLH